jgi:hypothetical protein
MHTAERELAPASSNGANGQLHQPGQPRNGSRAPSRVGDDRRADATKDGARLHCHVVPGLNVLPDRQGGGADRFS